MGEKYDPAWCYFGGMLDTRVQRDERPWQVPILGALALLVMGVFAVHFAKERLYEDAGQFLTRLVDREAFFFVHHRWIMPVAQWLPLLGVKAGLGLPTVIVLFSLSNVAFATGAWLFTSMVLRDRTHALVLLAAQFIGLSQTLFNPVFELYYGAMLLILLRAVLLTKKLRSRPRSALAVILFLLVATSHFLALLVLLFMLVLDRIWEQRAVTLWFGVTLALLLAHRFSDMSAYEGNAFGTVLSRLRDSGLPWVFAPGRLLGQVQLILRNYPDVGLISLAGIILAYRTKARHELALFAGGHLVLYTLISLYYPDRTHNYYREFQDHAHAAWTLVFAAWAMQRSIVWERWALRLFSVFLILRMAWVVHLGGTFTERTHWMQDRIAAARRSGVSKGLVRTPCSFVPPGINTIPLHRPAPFEYLLLSAMDGPEHTLLLASFPDGASTSDNIRMLKGALPALPRRTHGAYFHIPEGPFRMVTE